MQIPLYEAKQPYMAPCKNKWNVVHNVTTKSRFSTSSPFFFLFLGVGFSDENEKSTQMNKTVKISLKTVSKPLKPLITVRFFKKGIPKFFFPLRVFLKSSVNFMKVLGHSWKGGQKYTWTPPPPSLTGYVSLLRIHCNSNSSDHFYDFNHREESFFPSYFK